MQALYLAMVVLLFVWGTKVYVKIDPLVITLPNGKIRGHQLISLSNKVFYGFQGIPYARPPVGNLRFQAPLPAENWTGILNATKDGYSCIGKVEGYINSVGPQNEDCLFINVYTPQLRSENSELLPVMFWIYGGAFAAGSSEYEMYGPDYLIEEDIVFVSMNYRVGALGFLSTGDTVIPGNAGLKDQLLALKWTQQNIHLFGGDPNKVTLFGESAGSMSSTYHVLSPQSKGLFRGAISNSGSALCSASVNHEPRKYALHLLSVIAKNENFTFDPETISSEDIKQNLTELPVEVIVTAIKDIWSDELTKPTIEVPHSGAFLTESPYKLLETGNFTRVPIMIGHNSEEFLGLMGSIDLVKGAARLFDETPNELLPSDSFLKEDANVTEVIYFIKDIYLEKNKLFQDNLGSFIQYASDDMMSRGITKHAELQSNYTDVFFFQFSYHGVMGGNASYDEITGTLLGNVAHGEDLLYLFRIDTIEGNTTDLSIYPEQDIIVHKRMIKMWTNFVKTLNPTPEKLDLLQNITWPAIKQPGFQYLDINADLTIVNDYPRKNNYEKWNEIFYKYGKQPFYNF